MVLMVAVAGGCANHRPGWTSSNLKVGVGDSITEALPANAGTGYVWALDEQGSKGLDLVNVELVEQFVQPRDGRLGARGQSIWRIKGLDIGRASLRFVYRRPWEPEGRFGTVRQVNVDVY